MLDMKNGANRMRTPRPGSRVSNEIKAGIVRSVKEAIAAGNYNTREIAEYLGVTASTAWRYLVLAGYEYRGGWQPKAKR